MFREEHGLSAGELGLLEGFVLILACFDSANRNKFAFFMVHYLISYFSF
jgi:hypothetical protein